MVYRKKREYACDYCNYVGDEGPTCPHCDNSMKCLSDNEEYDTIESVDDEFELNDDFDFSEDDFSEEELSEAI